MMDDASNAHAIRRFLFKFQHLYAGWLLLNKTLEAAIYDLANCSKERLIIISGGAVTNGNIATLGT